jgi:hypothetical protein
MWDTLEGICQYSRSMGPRRGLIDPIQPCQQRAYIRDERNDIRPRCHLSRKLDSQSCYGKRHWEGRLTGRILPLSPHET